MAHTPAARARAERLYLDGHPYHVIEQRTRVPVSTLKRWAKKRGWRQKRERLAGLELKSMNLLDEVLDAAAESRDPQQVFAASKAARLAGVDRPTAPAPSAATMARAMVKMFDRDPELGPIMRRRRAQLVQQIAEEAERMEVGA